MTTPLQRAAGALGLATAALLAACGGGGSEDTGSLSAADAGAAATRKIALKGGNDCIGSCTGGGGTPVAGAANPLPTSAPAPGILVRESFGPGPEQLRPKGGKGDMRSAFLHTTLGGFWVEWPGNKANAWITPNGDPTWKFAGAGGNPAELPSPLQAGPYGYEGVAYSELFDVVNPVFPTALLPVSMPTAGRWALSLEGYPTNVPDSYLGLGLTDSGATVSNLTGAARVALLLHATGGAGPAPLRWELWAGGATRTLLASGSTEDVTFNHLELRYDPRAQLLEARINDTAVGPFPFVLGVPRYAGFEGLGLADNFMLRTLP